ncbi:hypothetical protein [Bradyrhizobium australafricanum]|uniref:hypothetical protein n=1 Tax=Bradyrhizobium australafricanum TaxID=2821406 RepID=UPI001CE256AB|nr:hypothetical protein [Bradyrhizobium australafricanum]MCA6102786.1 hypothetical protein [Bradyrhizobium australafricanum]
MATATDPNLPEKPDLGASGADVTVAVLRSFVSVIPGFGQALQEVVTAIVPNQRAERVEKYLVFLSGQIDRLQIAADEIKRPESVDLIEEGAYQAVRALTDERKLQIATVVANGLASEEQSKLRQKRLLKILGDLDDQELLILQAYADDHVQSRLQDIRPPPVAMSAPRSEKDRSDFYEWSRDNLHQRGLIKTGLEGRHRSTTLTVLGRAVLRAADLLPIGGLQDRIDKQRGE